MWNCPVRIGPPIEPFGVEQGRTGGEQGQQFFWRLLNLGGCVGRNRAESDTVPVLRFILPLPRAVGLHDQIYLKVERINAPVGLAKGQLKIDVQTLKYAGLGRTEQEDGIVFPRWHKDQRAAMPPRPVYQLPSPTILLIPMRAAVGYATPLSVD